MPKVTIVVPGYNAERHLRECLDSVVSQTLEDIEVLLIDDGSEDDTGKIFDEYAQRYPFVRVVHQENCGIFSTRAKAIGLAKGDFIGWVDSDDFIASDMFEILYQAAAENESDLVYCNYSCYPQNIPTKEKWFKQFSGTYGVDFVERNSQFWNKIVSRQLLMNSGICDLLPNCFEESMIKVLLSAKKPIAIDKELYFYRVGAGSMSSRYKNVAYYKRFIQASEKLRDSLTVDFPEKYWTDYFLFRIVYYCLMTLIVAANAGDKEEFYRIRKQLRLEHPKYWKNPHYWPVLFGIYGKAKAFLIGCVVPVNFELTHLMCRFAFR